MEAARTGLDPARSASAPAGSPREAAAAAAAADGRARTPPPRPRARERRRGAEVGVRSGPRRALGAAMAKVDREMSKTAMFLVMNVLSSVTIIMVRLSPEPGPRAPPPERRRPRLDR